MRFRGMTVAAALVCACAFAGSALAAANPAYDSWAKCKPGTSVVMKMTTEAAGQKTEMEQTYTLQSVTPEKAVVELKQSMTMAGNKMDMPAQNLDIPAATPEAPKGPDGQPIKADTKTSEETITVGGTEYKTTCTETTSDANGMKVTAKVWTTPDVPGGTVKIESKTEGAVASTTTGEVTKVEKK